MSQKELKIYTWDHCPYCRRALALLNEKKVQFEQIRLDGDEEARAEMSKHTIDNRKSVPQIFVDGKNIGGCDDLYALEEAGELDSVLGLVP
jgi:glutaredoxin 3